MIDGARKMPDPARCLDELRSRDLLPDRYECVYATGSIVRGWGNETSDFDLYVITDAPWQSETSDPSPVALFPETIGVEIFHVDGVRWDVEYWTTGQVDQAIAKTSWKEYEEKASIGDLITVFERDFLERLLYAMPVDGAEWLEQRRRQVADSAFRRMIVARALHNVDTVVEDAVGMLRQGDHDSAVLAARLAFTWAVDALTAAHGVMARSTKWQARRLREAEQSVLSYEDYWAIETMRGYDPADPQRWVADVIAACRTIATNVSV
jgi:predicted nucleotidyltransferase